MLPLMWCSSVLQIGIEDFRVMTESFGMQLDDDSLLALFSRVMLLAAWVHVLVTASSNALQRCLLSIV